MTTRFEPEDIRLHQRITELDCPADGEIAACTVQSIDRDSGDRVSHVWTVALDGSRTTQVTRGSGSDRSPTWSPGGTTLAFLSDRAGGSPQVLVIDLDGGEARQIGQMAQVVMNLQWFPDGRGLLVAAAVTVDPELRGKRPSGPPAPRSDASPEILWKLPYKSDGIGYLLQREIHLFRLDLETGESTQLTDGAFDVLGYDISADGRRIAYTRTRAGRFAHCSDLWICDADGGNPRRMTDSHATVMGPSWSPDGAWIAFSGAEEEGDAQPKLWVSNTSSGEIRLVGDDSLNVADERSLGWLDDDRLVFKSAFRGRHQIASIGLRDAQPTTLAGGDRQFGVCGRTARHFVYSVDHPAHPSELWVCGAAPDEAAERRLTRFNAWWDDRTPLEVAVRTFDVPDGRGGTETIEGWLLRAQGATGPMPLLNDVHGGPAAYALLDFESNVYWQVLASRGWAVLMLNAVGSASYGTEFCRRLLGHWGEADLPQHLAAVAQLKDEGLCDDRVAIAGKSYGGFLSAWTIGHTDVFKAAVVMAPVGNLETHYGTSDGGYYADPFYLKSEPKFDRELARALSPLQHIEKATTPTLFLQGKDDERCPKCQSEELFVSLMRAGETPAELILYPNEGHGFLGGGGTDCRIDAAGRIVVWVERFTEAPREAGHDRERIDVPEPETA